MLITISIDVIASPCFERLFRKFKSRYYTVGTSSERVNPIRFLNSCRMDRNRMLRVC